MCRPALPHGRLEPAPGQPARTVKGFLYLSQEFLPHVTQVGFDDSYFADHAVLSVKLSQAGLAENLRRYQFGACLAHCRMNSTSVRQASSLHIPSLYRAIWAEYEA